MPPEKFVPIWEDCKDMGVLMGKGGLFGNVSGVYHNAGKNIDTNIALGSVPAADSGK